MTDKHDGQWLCYAWGESEKPMAFIANTRAQVRQFLVNQWFGEDQCEALDEVMAEFDADEWEDECDKLEYQFEIGGVSIERIFQSAIPHDLVHTWNLALDAAIRTVERTPVHGLQQAGLRVLIGERIKEFKQ